MELPNDIMMPQNLEGLEQATQDLKLNHKALLSLNKKYVNSPPGIKQVIDIVAEKLDLELPFSFEDIVNNLHSIEDHFMKILQTFFEGAKWFDYFSKSFNSIRDNCKNCLHSSVSYEKVNFEAYRPREDPDVPEEGFQGDLEALELLKERTQICDICEKEIIGYDRRDLVTNGGKELYPGAQPWVREPNFEVIMACMCSVKCGQKKRAIELQFIRSQGIRVKRLTNINIQEACPICFTVSPRLKKCGACKCAYYCSVSCQDKDWNTHKKICKDIVEKQKQGLLF